MATKTQQEVDDIIDDVRHLNARTGYQTLNEQQRTLPNGANATMLVCQRGDVGFTVQAATSWDHIYLTTDFDLAEAVARDRSQTRTDGGAQAAGPSAQDVQQAKQELRSSATDDLDVVAREFLTEFCDGPFIPTTETEDDGLVTSFKLERRLFVWDVGLTVQQYDDNVNGLTNRATAVQHQLLRLYGVQPGGSSGQSGPRAFQ